MAHRLVTALNIKLAAPSLGRLPWPRSYNELYATPDLIALSPGQTHRQWLDNRYQRPDKAHVRPTVASQTIGNFSLFTAAWRSHLLMGQYAHAAAPKYRNFTLPITRDNAAGHNMKFRVGLTRKQITA